MLPKVHSQVSLFELDEEETAGVSGKGSTWSTSMSDAAALATLRGVLTHEAGLGLQIQRDVERARRQACGGGESTASVEALALALSNMGYDYVRVRRATGGGAGASCLRNLRHSFLLVAAPGDRDHTPFVVDPDFAEQFLIAKPTPRYSAFLSILSDSVLVIRKTTSLRCFLCAELAAAFRETNTVLPPWRLATSMLSKWTSRASIDEVPRACRREDGGSSGEAAHVFGGSGAAAEAEPMRGIFVSAPRHSSGAVAMEPIRVIGGFSRMSYILA